MSAVSKTFRQVVEAFRSIASDHMQINEFQFGDAWELVLKDHKFPMLFLQATDSTITVDQILLNFYIVCMDIPSKDESDELEIQSDTLQILNDVICLLKDGEDDYGFSIQDDSISIVPFTEQHDFEATGWTATITVEIENPSSICDIPLASTFIPPTPPPEPTSTLTVMVEDGSGLLIENATVTLYDSEGQVVNVKVTDENGEAIFLDLDFGDYTIDVTADDYIDVTGESVTVDEEAESTTITMTEVTYYIASVDDIYGAAMTVTISSTSTQPTYTEFTLSEDYDGSVGDKVYTGYNFASNLMEMFDVQGVDSNIVQINDPDFVTKENGRFAKLSVLPAVIEGSGYTGRQGVDVGSTITFLGQNLTSEFLVGAPVRITTAAGDVFYDIVYECVYKLGNTGLTCYMGQYIASDTVVVQTLSFI